MRWRKVAASAPPAVVAGPRAVGALVWVIGGVPAAGVAARGRCCGAVLFCGLGVCSLPPPTCSSRHEGAHPRAPAPFSFFFYFFRACLVFSNVSVFYTPVIHGAFWAARETRDGDGFKCQMLMLRTAVSGEEASTERFTMSSSTGTAVQLYHMSCIKSLGPYPPIRHSRISEYSLIRYHAQARL